ncbi:hypothetical protein QBC39DRAFT_249730 [Podospora conica]|nr:hypothetical protein QBC39DRAFT_249730 [Schizothecium conicum]
MNNFGVIEVAGPKTTRAPGWAYVPDSGPTPAQALQPTNRKRAARNQAGLSSSDVSARQDAKIRKDLEALDRDTNKDVNIPIPPKTGSNRAQNKHTPNVRKILQSQKTFANHLDDYQALLALAETNPAAAAALNPANPPTPAADVEMPDAPPPGAPEPDPEPAAESYPPDGTILPAYRRAPPPSHPGDDDPLLVSHVPPFPTDDELRALMTAPPLSYLEARAACGGGDEARYPARAFCEVCGYWGRVRCVKCGARVCALDCLDVHRQECVTRYGL